MVAMEKENVTIHQLTRWHINHFVNVLNFAVKTTFLAIWAPLIG